MSVLYGSIGGALLALSALATIACGSSVCEEATSVAVDQCGVDDSTVEPECSDSDECAAQCVVDNDDVYCAALRGDPAAVATMDACTSACGK